MFHLSFSIWMMIALTGNQQQRRNVHVRLIMWFALVKVWLHPLTQAATLLCAKIIKSLWHISQHVPAQHFREKILIKFQTFDTEQILKCQNSKWWTGQNKSVMCVLRKTNYHIVLQDIIWDCEGLLMMMVCLMDNEMVVQVARDTTTSCFDDSFIPFSLEFCFELVIDTLFENCTKSLISQNREQELRFW